MSLFTNNRIIVLILFLTGTENSQPATDPVFNKICAGSCSGEIAWVTAWSDSTGKIDYYEFVGDFRTCPHFPLILYDSKGREVLAIPNQPVDPNNKEMPENFEKLLQKRKELLNGHTRSNPLSCSENSK